MTILHHGFQIPDHDAIYSRMNLISAVPLKVNSQDQLSSPVQNLDKTMESVSNVLSKHTRNIDSWLSTQDKYKSKRKKQEVLLPFDRGPPIEYQNDLFISSSPAIEKTEQTDKIDENVSIDILDKTQNYNSLNSPEIIDHNIEQITEKSQNENISLKRKRRRKLHATQIEQQPKNDSEIEDEGENCNKNANYSEIEYDEEEEEEEEEAKELEKQKSPKNSKETTKVSNFSTEEIENRRRLKSLLKTRNISPEPCTYEPNFEAVLPTINVPQLPPKDKNNFISRAPVKSHKQIELMSYTEVLGMYHTKLREFNTDNVHIRNFDNLHIRYPAEEKNIYDYVYKESAKTEVNDPSSKLSQSESISSISDSSSHPTKTNNTTKSKSKSSNYTLSTPRLKKSGTNPQKSKKSKQIKRPNINNIEKSDNYILRPTSTLGSKVPRDEVYRNFSAAKNLGPGQYNLPQPKPPSVLDMASLHDRDCLPTKKSLPCDYPLAVEQSDNLRPKKPFHPFSTDSSRETKIVKNRRVEMLDKFKKEKQDLINEICKKSSLMSAKISSISSKNSSEKDFEDDDESDDVYKTKGKRRKISISEMAEDNIYFNVNRRSKSSIKKRTPFDIQSSRPSLLPGEKNYANENEPVYPFDPIESFKKINPGPKFVTIKTKPKPLPDEKFWTTTWYGT